MGELVYHALRCGNVQFDFLEFLGGKMDFLADLSSNIVSKLEGKCEVFTECCNTLPPPLLTGREQNHPAPHHRREIVWHSLLELTKQ
jgi:hypothetical protein